MIFTHKIKIQELNKKGKQPSEIQHSTTKDGNSVSVPSSLTTQYIISETENQHCLLDLTIKTKTNLDRFSISGRLRLIAVLTGRVFFFFFSPEEFTALKSIIFYPATASV